MPTVSGAAAKRSVRRSSPPSGGGGLPSLDRLFYTRTPNGTGGNAGKYVARAGDAACFAAAPELYTDVNTPLAFTAAELIAMQGHEWSWQFSTTKGLSIYAITATTETINKARRYHRLALIYPRLAWGIGYGAGLHSQYGPEPAFASAGVVPGGNGTTLPQNTLPVDATGRGVYCGPGYQNLLQNTAFVGGVSGTPGTAPTNWSLYNPVGTLTFLGNEATVSCANDRAFLYQTISVLVSTRYNLGVVVYAYSEVKISELCAIHNIPSGATITYMLDGVSVTSADIVPVGAHRLICSLLVSTTAGSPYFRLGIGCLTTSTGSAKFSKPQVTIGYAFPYVISPVGGTTTVTSCAGTSGNNGLGWTMDAGVLECLRGETDGVELNPAPSYGGTWAGAGSTPPTSVVADTTYLGERCKSVTFPVNSGGYAVSRASSDTLSPQISAGNRISVRFKVAFSRPLTGSESFVVYGTGAFGITPTPITSSNSPTWNSYIVAEFTSPSSGDIWPTVYSGPILSPLTVYVTEFSFQRLLPSRCTVAALVTMGVGSGELAAGVASNFLSWKNSATDLKFGDSSGTKQIATLTDGATTLEQASAWDRYIPALISFRTNQAGTYYQLGYRRIGVDSAMVWGSLGVYDGSLNPGSVLRSALNGTLPLWKKSMQVWDRPVTDAAIYDWAITRLGGGA